METRASASAATGTGIVDVIKGEHRTVEKLYADYGRASNTDEKQIVANKIVTELWMHGAKEEMVLYPFIKTKLGSEGERLVKRSLDEHQVMKNTLYELEQMKVTDRAYPEKMNLVIKEMQEHVQEEETEVLVKLSKVMSNEESATLAEDFAKASSKVPKLPHPSAPTSHPLNVAAGMFSKGLDEATKDTSETRKTDIRNP